MTVTLNTLARVQAARSYYSAMEHADADENWLTIERRLNMVVSPFDFGALGDNGDDTTALLAAVAHCNETGKTLDLGVGVFNTSETLLQTACFMVIGAGGGFSQQARGATVLSAKSRIKWIGAAGGTIWKMQTPASVERRTGGGMINVMLDGNAQTAAKCLEIDTWAGAYFRQCSFYGATEDQVYTRTLAVSAPQGPGDFQHSVFDRCFASSIDGSSSGYGTNSANGFRFTGAVDGNTSFVTIRSCRATTSTGKPYVLENTDNVVIDNCHARVSYDETVEHLWFRSGENCSHGSGNGSRYCSMVNSQLSVRVEAGQAGGNSAYGITILNLSRANSVPVPVVETPAGGSLAPTVFVQESGVGTRRQSGTIQIDGDYVLTSRKDDWELPTGAESRETFDTTTVTTAQLAARFKALLKDLSQYHHGLVGLTADAGTADADVVADGEADVMTISFIDDTMRVIDTATPANNYSGAAISNLTVTGTLTASADGAYFDDSNYATIATSAIPWLDATGTLMVEYEVEDVEEDGERVVLSVDDGAGNRHEMMATKVDKDRCIVRGAVGGVVQYQFVPAQGINADVGAIRRLVVTFEADNVIGAWDRVVRQGIPRDGFPTASMPSPTTLRIGVDRNNARGAQCNIRRVFLAPRKMTIAEAQNLSRVLI